MKASQDKSLRQHLVALLQGGGAHVEFNDVIGKVPAKLRGAKARGLPHSPWMLVEHMRIAQRDILDFCRNPRYVAPKWPEGYWPQAEAPPSAVAWGQTVKNFGKDLKAMQSLVTSAKTNLFAKIAWGDGQTILREALLVADHNAYHLAQVVDVLRGLGVWE
jgi:hypothetical protein